MSNYYEKQDAKVRIAHELMNRGWNIEGYKADESDSMIDYYSPAYWGGIAIKNGYVLVVDNSTAAESREITKYNPKGNLSIEDREKISKLEQMTQERGATAGEEANAKALIERIKEKVSDCPAYEVVGMTTAHMANPGKCKWHIEKDGKIYDKGTGITKYADLPNEWQYDIVKMEYKDSYKQVWTGMDENGFRIMEDRKLSDEIKKLINDFKALILRFERVAMGLNSCGDGTKETEEAGKEQQKKAGYEKVIKQAKKTVLKMVEVDRKYVQVGDYLTMKHHGGFWLVTNTGKKKGTWKINGVPTQLEKNTFDYEQVGAASRGYKQVKNTTRYYQWEDSLLRDIESGTTKIFELKEVEEIQDVETWEKIDKSKKIYNSNKETKQEEKTEQPTNEEQPTESIINHEIIITADTDTRDNSELWVVKINDILSNEEYKKVSKQFKALKGYYSKFKKGFIFKYDPTEVLKGSNGELAEEQTAEEVKETEQTTSNNTYDKSTENENICNQSEIEDGFIYDCHFKSWNLTPEDIKSYLKVYEIPFIDWGLKVGFAGITADQARGAKEVSDLNGSIFFIDEKMNIEEYNNIESEIQQAEQEAEKNNIIDFEEYKNNNEVEEVENNNNSNDFNFDDILNQFENIEINNNSRISADDEEFCKEQERLYSESFDMFLEFYNRAFTWYQNNKQPEYGKYIEDYLSHDNSFSSLQNAVFEINKKFIRQITSYFEKQYKISIDGNKIENALIKELSKDSSYYRSNQFIDALKKTNYNSIIGQIFIQLDGFSFQDKAVKELKDETRKIYHYNDYRKSSNMNIKNNRVIIDGYYAYKDWDVYRIRGNFNKIFTALYHFENGTIPEDKTELHNKYCGYANEKNQSNFDKYEPETLTKITGIKFFKNGKLEIEFKSNQNATYFAKEYLGYTEQNTKSA